MMTNGLPKRPKTKAEWAEIVLKARHTGKMANTLAKALAKRYAHRWQFVDFRGPNGEESAGIVDIVAIRKSSKKPNVDGLKKLDTFDIVLIQVKGGKAHSPTNEDITRLKKVGDIYAAQAIVLFEWNKNRGISRFLELSQKNGTSDAQWEETTAAKLFGKTTKISTESHKP